MPSFVHEALIDLLRGEPRLALQLAAEGGPAPARGRLAVVEAELSGVALRADLAVKVGGRGRGYGVLVEVQLRREAAKRWVWPAYVALLRRRHCVPFRLVVLTPSPAVAAWARQPLALDGRGCELRPIVIGPAELPPRLDPAEAAADLDLALLAALTHRRDPRARQICRAAMLAAQRLPAGRATAYTDLIHRAFGPLAHQIEEEHMPLAYKPYTDFAKGHFERGRQEGVEQGIAQGIARGVERGQRLALQSAVLTLWAGRFPGTAPSADLRRALERAPEAALHEALLCVAGAADAEAAAQALGARLR